MERFNFQKEGKTSVKILETLNVIDVNQSRKRYNAVLLIFNELTYWNVKLKRNDLPPFVR